MRVWGSPAEQYNVRPLAFQTTHPFADSRSMKDNGWGSIVGEQFRSCMTSETRVAGIYYANPTRCHPRQPMPKGQAVYASVC
jgi:hypothetical protein